MTEAILLCTCKHLESCDDSCTGCWCMIVIDHVYDVVNGHPFICSFTASELHYGKAGVMLEPQLITYMANPINLNSHSSV